MLSRVWLFCNTMNGNSPSSSVHGISWTRVLEWIAFSFPEDPPFQGRNLCLLHLQVDSFTTEPPGKLFPAHQQNSSQRQDRTHITALKRTVLWYWVPPVAQLVKNLPVIRLTEMQEAWVQSLGWENLLEKEMATYSIILAWEIPSAGETGRLQFMGLQESDRLRN